MKRDIWEREYNWYLAVDNFKVQVRSYKDYTGYAWCLYVWVYPDHPFFDKPEVFIEGLDWHGGCTFSKAYVQSDIDKHSPDDRYMRHSEGEYLRIGCDYQHSFSNVSNCDPAAGMPYVILKDLHVLIDQMRLLVKGV